MTTDGPGQGHNEHGWRYDACQHDPLTARRIPVLHHPDPEHSYEIAVLVSSPDHHRDGWVRPEPHEVEQLASFLEFRLHTYTGHHRAVMAREPFDIDSGLTSTSTIVLGKRDTGAWLYRRANWEMGPLFSPPEPRRLSLPELLAHIIEHDPCWRIWVERHPDVFPEAS